MPDTWAAAVRIAFEYAAACKNPEDAFYYGLHRSMLGSLHYQATGQNADGSVSLEGGWQNNRPALVHNEHRYMENLKEALGAPRGFYFDPRQGLLHICLKKTLRRISRF